MDSIHDPKNESPESLETLAFAGFDQVAKPGRKADLTTGMTTDRKNIDFRLRSGIMAKTEYPGVVQLIERAVWDREAESLSLSTRTTFAVLTAQTPQSRDALRLCYNVNM